MNMQAMMRQAQKLQNDMLKEKQIIDNTTFSGENGLVKVKVNGKKELLEVNIDNSDFDKDDLEMLQDMILIAVNEAFKKVDQMTEEKMGKFSNLTGGLF